MRKMKTQFSRLLLISLLAVMTLVGTSMADGLPGEYYVTQRWRDLLAPYSAATNPALLTEANYVTVRAAVSPSLGSAFILYEAGATVPLGLYQSVGLSVLGVTSNEPIIESEWDPITGIQPTGREYHDNHMLFMGSYAINPWNKLSVGANLNVYRTPNFEDPIVGMSLDLGVTWRALNHSVLGQHIIGVNFQNVLSPNFFSRPAGEPVDWQTNAINTKISWMGKVWDSRIDFGFDFDFKDYTSVDKYVLDDTTGIKNAGPGDWEFDFNGRIGFWILRMLNVYGHFGTGHWGASIGVNMPSIFGGHDMQAAYQYMSITDDDLAYTHTFYFRGEFGQSREAVYAKKMARNVDLLPGQLYEQAMALYYKEKYWEAYFIFGRILTDHPDFFKNDDVKLYMGLCQENMDMREFAAQSYNEMLDEYRTSPAKSLANLGLLRLAYRDNNSTTMEEQYALINQPTVTDTVKQAAAYYMGSQRMVEGRYMEAIQLFDLVMPTHSDYPFAQHSMAIAYAIEGNLPSTLEHLDNAIQFVPSTEAQKEIIARSYLLLGYLFYEGGAGEGQQSMAKSVSALLQVKEDSYYHTEALLGRAWVALKSNQWDDCKATAEQLKSKSDNVILRGEADLMIAYYYLTHQQYANAEAILQKASDSLHAFNPPTAGELAQRETKYFEDREKYYEVAAKADELSRVNQSTYVKGQIDSIGPSQKEYEEAVRSFAKYKDGYDAAVFFGRDIDRVTGDVDYALTKAIELKQQYGDGTVDSTLIKTEEDIEALLKELEALEGDSEETPAENDSTVTE